MAVAVENRRINVLQSGGGSVKEHREIWERTSGLESSKSRKNSPLVYSCAAGACREVLKGTRAELCEVVVSAVDLAGANGGCVLD